MKKLSFYHERVGLCSEIFYTKEGEPVIVKNYVDKPLLCALGVNKNPTWDDLQSFLRERCFPEERPNKKNLLKLLGVPYYSPELIIEKTEGRMVEDLHYIKIENIDDMEKECIDGDYYLNR